MAYPEDWEGPHEVVPQVVPPPEPDPDSPPHPDGPWDDAHSGPDACGCRWCLAKADSLADAIALVEAIARDDLTGTAILLKHAPVAGVAITLGKILANGVHPEDIASGEWRTMARIWANRS